MLKNRASRGWLLIPFKCCVYRCAGSVPFCLGAYSRISSPWQGWQCRDEGRWSADCGGSLCFWQPSASVSPSWRQGSEAGAALRGGGREDIHCQDRKSSLGRAPALWPWDRPMEISSPKTSKAKENLYNTCSSPFPFIFHLGRLGLLKLHRGRFERLRVCFCESCANLATFPNSHLLDVSEFIHPRILWELLTLCTAHTAQVLLLVYHPSLAVGFLAAIKCFSRLLPRSVSLAPRLWGSLAALQGMSFKGVHFLKEKPSSVLVQKTSFLSYILFF